MNNRTEYLKKYTKEHKKERQIYSKKYRKQNQKKIKKWRKDHKTEIKKISKEYYAKPEIKKKRKAYMKKYQNEHKHEIAEKMADYFQNHKEQFKKYNETWEQSVGKEQVRLLARKRTKKSEQKLKLETFQQYTPDLSCQNCKRKLDLIFLTVQHKRGRKHHNHDRTYTGAKMYRWLKKYGYPKKDFEVWCFNCNSTEGKRHTDEPKVFINKDQKHYFKTRLPKLMKSKEKCLKHYGKFCACCGEKNTDWLSIEHSAGKKGAIHPKGYQGLKLFRWLDLNKLPKGYKIFCYNCNSAKGNLLICPHLKREKN